MGLREVAKSFRHTPSAEDKNWGRASSVRSEGVVGKINRAIARATRQQEVDIVLFVKTFIPEK